MGDRGMLSPASEIVGASGLNGPEPTINTGSTVAFTTLNAVTANTIGTTVDAGAAKSNWTAIALATGSPTDGNIFIELSLDGTNWVQTQAVINVISAGTFLCASSLKPARYARASLYNLIGTGTITVKMQAAS